jgi:integrase
LSKEFRQLIVAARIEQRVIRERGKSGRNVNALSFHSLRHSFTSLLASQGISEETRMALCGHTSREIHQHYTHRELGTLRDAIATLPRI